MNALSTAVTNSLNHQTYQLILSLQDALRAEQSKRDGISQASQQLCEHLLGCYQHPHEKITERLALAPWQERKAKEILSRSLNARLFIADVAEQCAMSRSHFSRAFKKATGMSPQEWSLDLRIRRAKELLSEESLAISLISLECGFADQSHFSRMFSKLAGITPNRWRQLKHLQAEPA
jgi:AraC family transcriptional regulator